MTGGPVGVGIVGAGVISDTYLENLTSFPDVRVLRVADLDTGRAAARAAEYGVPRSGTGRRAARRPGRRARRQPDRPGRARRRRARRARSGQARLGGEAPRAGPPDRPQAPRSRTGEGPSRRERPRHRARRRVCRPRAGPSTRAGSAVRSRRWRCSRCPGPEAWHPAPEFLLPARRRAAARHGPVLPDGAGAPVRPDPAGHRRRRPGARHPGHRVRAAGGHGVPGGGADHGHRARSSSTAALRPAGPELRLGAQADRAGRAHRHRSAPPSCPTPTGSTSRPGCTCSATTSRKSWRRKDMRLRAAPARSSWPGRSAPACRSAPRASWPTTCSTRCWPSRSP